MGPWCKQMWQHFESKEVTARPNVKEAVGSNPTGPTTEVSLRRFAADLVRMREILTPKRTVPRHILTGTKNT